VERGRNQGHIDGMANRVRLNRLSYRAKVAVLWAEVPLWIALALVLALFLGR